jgi:hypothetical protein
MRPVPPLVVAALAVSGRGASGATSDGPDAATSARAPHVGPYEDLVLPPAPPGPSDRRGSASSSSSSPTEAPSRPPRPSPARRTRPALARRRPARSSARFRDLARDTSDDEATTRVGGALGNIEQWVMPEGFYEAAPALPVGGVSEVVETPRGFHIVRRTR